MKKFCVFILLIAIGFACSGDCLSCHASLGGDLGRDADHKVLLDCVTCHREVTNPNAACGGNCISCHTKINENVPEHLTLNDCKSCHIGGSSGGFLDGMFGSPQNQDGSLENSYKRLYKEPK